MKTNSYKIQFTFFLLHVFVAIPIVKLYMNITPKIFNVMLEYKDFRNAVSIGFYIDCSKLDVDPKSWARKHFVTKV